MAGKNEAGMRPTRAPAGLSAESRRWFMRVAVEFDFRSGGELMILEQVARARDQLAIVERGLREPEDFIERSDRGTQVSPSARLAGLLRNQIFSGLSRLGIAEPRKAGKS